MTHGEHTGPTTTSARSMAPPTVRQTYVSAAAVGVLGMPLCTETCPVPGSTAIDVFVSFAHVTSMLAPICANHAAAAYTAARHSGARLVDATTCIGRDEKRLRGSGSMRATGTAAQAHSKHESKASLNNWPPGRYDAGARPGCYADLVSLITA